MKTRSLGALLALLVGLSACDNLTADDHLARAEAYLSDEQINSAVIELKNALQKDPNLGAARLELGRQYLLLGNAPSALKELERALDLDEPRDTLLPLLLQAKLDLGRHQEVLGALELEPPPLNTALLSILGQAHLRGGELDEAQIAFESALGGDPKPARAYLGMAALKLANDDPASALRYLEEGLGVAPNDRRLWLAKADLNARAGELESAKAGYQQAKNLPGVDLMPELGLVRLMILERNLEGAQTALDALLKRAPRHPLVNYFAGVVAYESGDLEAAESYIRQVQALLPDHLQAMLLMGTIKYREKQYAQAENQLSRFVARVPYHVGARKILAATRLAADDPSGAVEALKPVADVVNDAEGLVILGTAYFQSGDYSTATLHLQRAAKLNPDQAQIRTQLALSLLGSGDSEAAETELQTAVALDQGVAQSEILLIMKKVQDGDLDAAAQAADDFIGRSPGNPIAHNLKGSVLLAKGNVDGAKVAFQDALNQDPSYAPAAANLARLALAENDVPEAKRQFERVLDANDNNLSALIGLAQLTLAEGDIDGATRLMERASLAHASAVAPRVILARIALSQQNFDRAAVRAEEAIGIAPSNIDARLIAAESALALGQIEIANGHLNRAHDLADRNSSPDAFIALGDLDLRMRNFDRAADTFRRVTESANVSAAALAGLTRAEGNRGDTEAARAAFDQLSTLSAPSAELRALEGEVLLVEGNLAEAEKQFRVAAEDGNRHALIKLGLLTSRTNPSSATTLYQRWLTEHPDDAGVQLALGQVQIADGNYSAATETYEQLNQARPDNALVLNNLAWLYAERGESKKAVEAGKRAHKLAPENPEIADTLGWVLLGSNGNLDEALRLLEQAARGRADNPTIQYHTAVAYARVGRHQECIEALRRSLEGPDFPERGDAEQLLAELSVTSDT